MTSYFEVEKYKDFLLKMQGGKQYLQVIGQLKAAIDYGVLLGVEQDIIETGDVLRAHSRIKILNKHIDGWESLPESLMVGYYDGYADNPMKGGKGAARDFPVEDALTSSLGRALTLAGFNYNTTATADEMAIVEKKKEVGNGYRTEDDIFSELATKLREQGVTSKAKANEAAMKQFNVNYAEVTVIQAREWLVELNKPKAPSVPF